MDTNLSLFLLSIRGRLAASTLEASRKVHNETAGAPANIAAVQSLGDVSHMVHVPIDGAGKGGGEFLILDLWSSMDGLNRFFADPHVQEGGSQIFTQRDPVVWAAAEGFTSYHIPAPFGRNQRIVATVRGMVRSVDEARRLHNTAITKTIGRARKAGNLSHEAYFRLAAPGEPEAFEFFGVDVWIGTDDMMSFYEDPEFLEGFNHLFTAEADSAVWVHPEGEWAEW